MPQEEASCSVAKLVLYGRQMPRLLQNQGKSRDNYRLLFQSDFFVYITKKVFESSLDTVVSPNKGTQMKEFFPYLHQN